MSRSYKKHPWYTDGRKGGQVISKRFANKTVRKYKHKIANKKAYKKLFCSYNIHDFISRWPWKEAKDEYEKNLWNLQERYSTIKDFFKHWNKNYRRK